MNLKEKIQKDFIKAMKSKDATGKRAISSLKAKITEAEKANKNTELSDIEIVKVVSSAIKQRRQSYDEYTKFDRTDLATIEMEDIRILEIYLPVQMSVTQIEIAVNEIIQSFQSGISDQIITNPTALIGKTIGEFNKKYTGMADIFIVKKIVSTLIN
jgi:uncharacterized protein YqeY